MNAEYARKLIDLYLDDELPLELVLEFKEAMFSDPSLADEVSSMRQAKARLEEAFEGDVMTEQERCRVFARVTVEAAAAHPDALPRPTAQLSLPLTRLLGDPPSA